MLAHETKFSSGPKNSRRGINVFCAHSHRPSATSTRESHRRFSRRGRETAVGSSLYLQPEPMIQNLWFVQGRASTGRQVPPFAYASNNPVTRVDPNGQSDLAVPASVGTAAAIDFAGGVAIVEGAAAAAPVAIGLAAGYLGSSVLDAPVDWGGTEPGAGVPNVPAQSVAPPSSSSAEPNVCEARGSGGGRTGERNHAGSASGTSNPWKHCRPHSPTQIRCKDPHTGDWKVKPKPPGFDEWWNSK